MLIGEISALRAMIKPICSWMFNQIGRKILWIHFMCKNNWRAWKQNTLEIISQAKICIYYVWGNFNCILWCERYYCRLQILCLLVLLSALYKLSRSRSNTFHRTYLSTFLLFYFTNSGCCFIQHFLWELPLIEVSCQMIRHFCKDLYQKR